MEDFRIQIKEDMEYYKVRNPHIANIDKDEWAFNYWVLDKLYSVDESLIEEQIVDYNDKGIDCWVWHEDLKDLYLIQNKYYGDDSHLQLSYVKSDFLVRAIGALRNNSYTRCPQLQELYTKNSNDPDFSIHLQLFVTNNTSKTQQIIDSIKMFNEHNKDAHIDSQVFDLSEIENLYYKEPIVDKKNFKFDIRTINKGTILSVNNDAYKLTLALDAKYVLTPVTVVYRLCKEAQLKKYPLFDENIREYLGSTGAVNKRIKNTLLDSKDRKNFFFYNNGITMIVNMLGPERNESAKSRVFEVENPQIVNGCQTVSTIFETLDLLSPETLEDEFSNTFVMIKILKIPSVSTELRSLYHSIVRYNNSQNSIGEKNFIAAKSIFKHLQDEFEWKGFLVCVKQSDKRKFKTQYPTPTKLLDQNNELLQKFGLEDLRKTDDFLIDLEKVLQVFLAFSSSPSDSIQNKSKLLVDQSNQNGKVIDFIKNYTTENKLNLFLLYLRAVKEKNKSSDGKTPNPFYLIYCFAKYDCIFNASKIASILDSREKVNEIMRKYITTLRLYHMAWVKDNPGKEYNDMIKSPISDDLLDTCKWQAETALEASAGL